MKYTRSLIIPAALVAVLGAIAPVVAQPAATGATATNPDNKRRAKAAGAGEKRPVQPLSVPMLGKILGRDLTDAEKESISAATTAYNEAIAKAVGLTAQELKDKAAEYRKANMGTRKDGDKNEGAKKEGDKPAPAAN